MTIERTEPPYMQLALTLRAKILNGDIPDGGRLPSIRDAAVEHDVSVATATKGYAQLRQWGLTQPRTGEGTFVDLSDVRHSGQDRMTTTLMTGKFFGKTGQFAKIVSAEVVTAPDNVADDLGLPHGAQVIRRQRVTHRADGTPLSTSISYHDAELAQVAPKLLTPERIIEGPAYVAEATGQNPAGGYDRLRARAATSEEAALLDIDAGDPVLQMTTQVLSTDGRSIEYGVSVSRSDREITYRYPLDGLRRGG